MAGTRISAATDGVTLDATDRLPIARSGSTAKLWITGTYIQTFLNGLAVKRLIRVVTAAGAVTVSATTDYIVVVNKTVGAATAVNLPAGVTGQEFVIKDGKLDAATNNITLTPAAGNIDGAATYVMNVNGQSVTIVYNGTQWNIT